MIAPSRVWATLIKPRLRQSRTLQRLRRLYWKARFRLLRRFAPSWKRGAPDGLPIPPQELRAQVSGQPEYKVADFLEMGRLCATRIDETLAKNGSDVRELEAILDFGCGCGRTLRHFARLERTRLCGTDYNPALIGWCRPNLAFAEFALNHLEPPLDYRDEVFDLVYAFSVFTHLPEPLQHSWMAEVSRVLRPGGYLALSTMPECMLPDEDARRRFRDGELVVLNASVAGTNTCIAFHPASYMNERLASGFLVLEFVPFGVGQDFWLLRKRPGSLDRAAGNMAAEA